MTLSEREIRFRSEYLQMMAAPRMLPDSGVTDMTRYHLYHTARYLARLKGFITSTGRDLQSFIDTDLGACLLAAVFTINNHMKTTGDDILTDLWDHFSVLVDRFRYGSKEVTMDAMESSFYAICEHCQFDPWENSKMRTERCS